MPEVIGRTQKCMRTCYGKEGTGYWVDVESTTLRDEICGEEERKEGGGFDGTVSSIADYA